MALPRARGRHTACHACTRQARSAGPCPCSIASAGARLCRMTRNRHEVALGLTPWSEPLHTFDSIRACPPTPTVPHERKRAQASPHCTGARPLYPARTRRPAHRASVPAPPQDAPRARRPRPGGGAPRQAAGCAVQRMVAVRGRRGQVEPTVQEHQRARRRRARRRGQRAHLVAYARGARARSSPHRPGVAAPAARARPRLRRQRRRIMPPVSYLWHVSQSCSGSAHCSTDLRDARPLLHRCHMALMERAGAQECLPPRADFT